MDEIDTLISKIGEKKISNLSEEEEDELLDLAILTIKKMGGDLNKKDIEENLTDFLEKNKLKINLDELYKSNVSKGTIEEIVKKGVKEFEDLNSRSGGRRKKKGKTQKKRKSHKKRKTQKKRKTHKKKLTGGMMRMGMGMQNYRNRNSSSNRRPMRNTVEQWYESDSDEEDYRPRARGSNEGSREGSTTKTIFMILMLFALGKFLGIV